MLDGLLGRGFSVKCKSLMKTTRARIEVLRKRAEAKQRFLKEDLAKLLSNGLDINAYGRTEEFIAGMNLLSCYDIVEQSCEYIVKQLSRMQKQGECPEECREAVASLMFAAARFSDLPELRDLRDIFQQRYENSLEAFVSQKFVEKVSAKHPATEKRLQALQDIASEFSIKWDYKGFEQRMSTPSVVATDEKSRIRNYGEGHMRKRDEKDHPMAGRKGSVEYREQSVLKTEGSSSQGDSDSLFRGRHILTENKQHLYHSEKSDTELKAEKSSSSSHGKMLDHVNNGYTRRSNSTHNPRRGASTEALSHEKADAAPSCVEHLGRTEKVIPFYNYSSQENAINSTRKGPEGGADSRGSKNAGSDLEKNFVDPASCNRRNVVNNSCRPQSESDRDFEEQFVASAKVKSHAQEKYHDYEEEKIPLPKPRSIRRKHHKSSSSHNNIVDNPEDVGPVNRISSSRRKDQSRKGLQILFDEEHHRKEDEERMIDKLLIHYSKKPSSYDAGKLRKKLRGQPPDQIISDVGESSLDRSRDVHDDKCEDFPPPTRSVSLPHEQTASPESQKVFTRANSFQPDNQARHVHPKLPDYDDLAARLVSSDLVLIKSVFNNSLLVYTSLDMINQEEEEKRAYLGGLRWKNCTI
ncbi:UNVERIFIED_CONTAM: hypothetical protein Scaly_1674600 [Sesamum calycinum]|uniref:Regulator of Vps4 activity in the MVB pathway protein n=1 Tax=Sesamum calycinum TaxID=2727403 RepID=A0AAW2NVS2_9LAMI